MTTHEIAADESLAHYVINGSERRTWDLQYGWGMNNNVPTLITDHTGQKLIAFSHFKEKNAKQIVKFYDLQLKKGICYAAGAGAFMINCNSDDNQSSDVIFMRDPIHEK